MLNKTSSPKRAAPILPHVSSSISQKTTATTSEHPPLHSHSPHSTKHILAKTHFLLSKASRSTWYQQTTINVSQTRGIPVLSALVTSPVTLVISNFSTSSFSILELTYIENFRSCPHPNKTDVERISFRKRGTEEYINISPIPPRSTRTRNLKDLEVSYRPGQQVQLFSLEVLQILSIAPQIETLIFNANCKSSNKADREIRR